MKVKSQHGQCAAYSIARPWVVITTNDLTDLYSILKNSDLIVDGGDYKVT